MTTAIMRPFGELLREAGNNSGPKDETWLEAFGRSRDSDTLESSNWRVAVAAISGNGAVIEDDESHDPEERTDWKIVRMGHWACGWIESLLVKPDSRASAIAQGLRERLEDYPVLSDDDYSALECEEYDEYLSHEESSFCAACWTWLNDGGDGQPCTLESYYELNRHTWHGWNNQGECERCGNAKDEETAR